MVLFVQMETLEGTKEENEIIATLSLLTMVIKSVPQPVLRKKFIDTGEIYLQLVEQFADSENQNVLRSVSIDEFTRHNSDSLIDFDVFCVHSNRSSDAFQCCCVLRTMHHGRQV